MKGQVSLEDWWRQEAEDSLQRLLPKVKEYGALDLRVIGQALYPDLPESSWAEAGCAFYLLGKIARICSAYQSGILPSEDSWHDAAVYARMGLRAQTVGGWPDGAK